MAAKHFENLARQISNFHSYFYFIYSHFYLPLLLLFRGHHHHHLTALQLGHLLYLGKLLKVRL